MSPIFVSYKREDEVRVSRLIRALERAGLPAWWDRNLAGGENWRDQIQTALDAAACVVVIWTHESVGPTGDFVRDEAGQAKRRGVLVPVLFDKVDPPLGFREVQAIDLTRWKGGQRDPFFRDLVAAVTARQEGHAPPAAKGPTRQLMRRLTYSGLASFIASGGVAFGLNLFRAQDRVCGLRPFEPHLSDVCGTLGLGDRPGRLERIAWEGRPPGSCPALRAHLVRFPDGAYRDDAVNLLAVPHVTQVETWTPGTRRLTLFIPRDAGAATTEAAAREAALMRAQPAADRLCKGFEATTSFRLRAVSPAAQVWDCNSAGGHVACAFEGEAVCEVEERQLRDEETCGN